jgi:hypothetical protein
MVYGTDAMIPAGINPPSWRRDTLTLEENSEALEENLDLAKFQGGKEKKKGEEGDVSICKLWVSTIFCSK